MLPQLPDAASRLTSYQQPRYKNGLLVLDGNHDNAMEYAMSQQDGLDDVYAQQQIPPGRSGGRRTGKRCSEDAHAHVSHPFAPASASHPQPQPQDPYLYPMGPSGPIHAYPPPPPPPPLPLPLPTDVHLNPPSRDETEEGDLEDDGEEEEDGERRRHPCPQCGKRFNRPSSLKIHLNTHTGAKREYEYAFFCSE